jgi:hypothetical protein
MERPDLSLNALEKTAIKVSSKEEFKGLMQVFEIASWSWPTESPVSSGFTWEEREEKEFCIDLEDPKYLTLGSEEDFKEDYIFLSVEDFYEVASITKTRREDIRKYLEKKYCI